ncbi:hypothetical protein GCM10007425_00900 [Lysinibacillus alkalisoli]|uniref:ABC transporter permease n=1 Tax=Lysinibacillus alkalisoli TaxID=1911548 RepID=A0A917FX54_9BACI|nr:ABC transporter permease subunit [Lysinibacillus alkalisoli]GGG10393.1 hypothetical protein GCM10007425_00900 [Lysinibacillus alkalisoli]
MNQPVWLLMQKEYREIWRSYRLIWLPLVFILLGIMDPLTTYYMKDILQAVGNIPEGMALTFPKLSPLEVLSATISQFQTIGIVIVIVLTAMMISKEREQGAVALLYIRPIPVASFIWSKLCSMLTLVLISVCVGMLASTYYITLLYGAITIRELSIAFSLYSIWLLFVISFALLCSAWCKNALSIALSVLVLYGGIIVDAILGQYWTISPWKLPHYAVGVSMHSVELQDVWLSIISSVMSSVIFIVVAMIAMKHKKDTVTI